MRCCRTLFTSLVLAVLIAANSLAAATPDTCLMFAARNLAKGGGNFYLYVGISNQKVAIAKGDALEYDIYLDKANPYPAGGVDIETDRGNLRDSAAVDQDGLKAHGNTELPAAVGKWHHRIISLDPLVGQTTKHITAVFESDKPGVSVQFLDNVVITHADKSKTVLYDGGELGKKPYMSKDGYSKRMLLKPVPRAKIVDGADLKPLFDEQMKAMETREQLDALRDQVTLVDTIAQRENDLHMREHAAAATAILDKADNNENLDADAIEALIHEVHAQIEHDHPVMEKYTGHLVGHAHIDFQWLWSWEDTITVCQHTFGQALKFMNEFPGFKFSQSSSALYATTEEHFPEIFKGIQKQVAAGNWEIVGGRVCEGDEHMISPESHAMHFLYGQRYFRERFNGKMATVGWEPDTFGHTWQMPQILLNGGCKYFYFCRGGHGNPMFWWQAPDGSKVLAFEEPATGGWYNGDVSDQNFTRLLDFAGKTGSKDMLWVYGVGNHGGGPTRENIETAIGYQKSGVMPNVKFSTATEFFHTLENYDMSKLPVVNDDLNTKSHAGFYGTYTSHSDIKRWNRDAESITESAEAIAAIASRYGFDYPGKEFRKNWEDITWNHHHDTLPGTSIHDSYSYSEKLFTRAIESSKTIGQDALAFIAAKVKGDGDGVIVFNPTGSARGGVVEVDAGDKINAAVPMMIGDMTRQVQHTATGKAIFFAGEVPPFGYRRYTLSVQPVKPLGVPTVSEDGTTLQNSQYRVVIDPAHGVVSQIIDLADHRNAIAANGSGNRLEIHWEDPNGMSAWTIGKINKVNALLDPVKLKVIERGPARVTVAFDRQFQSTTLHQKISLPAEGPPEFELATEWKELGGDDKPAPFLKVAFDVAAEKPKFIAQIPYGNIEKPTNGTEIPALTFCDLSDATGGAALMNDCKHGYSADGNTIRLSLIRTTHKPDPHPNDRPQMARWAFLPHAGDWRDAKVIQIAQAFNHPLWSTQLKSAPDASLPSEQSFLSPKASAVIVTGVKKAEDDNDLVVRFYEASGKPAAAGLNLPWEISKSQKVNFVEDPVEAPADADLHGYEIRTVKLRTH